MSGAGTLIPVRVSLPVASAALLGLVGSVLCLGRHTCMAGHMQHPPYGIADQSLDFVWPALVLFAAWRASRAFYQRPCLFASAAIALVLLRFFGAYLDVIANPLPFFGDVIGLAATTYLLGATMRLLWRLWRKPRDGRA